MACAYIYIYISFAVNCLVQEHSPTILLTLTSETNFSLDGVGLRGLYVDYVNYSSDYFVYYISPQVKPRFIKKDR
jgi:hypothetical protein